MSQPTIPATGYIDFSYNWNNKLQCHCFTTIRIFNPGKYQVGSTYTIRLKGTELGHAIISQVKPFMLHELDEYTACLDTGYNLAETCKIIQRMYPRIDFTRQKLSLILIHRIKS